MDEKRWYEEFGAWLAGNPDKIQQILNIYSKTTLKEIRNGKRGLDSIPAGKRIRLYDCTGLDFFKVDYEVHPKEMDVEKLITGEQPRSTLALRIEYDGDEKKRVSDMLNISKNQFARYLEGLNLEPSSQSLIENGLRKMYGKGAVAYSSVPDSHSVRLNSSVAAGFDALSTAMENLRVSLLKTLPDSISADLVSKGNPIGLEQRISSVNHSIGLLARQMDYFRGAPENERIALARSIDPDLWGYVAGILPHIDQPKTFATVMRLMPLPLKNKGAENV